MFAARFLLTLQYRAAALAGFAHAVLVGRHQGHDLRGLLRGGAAHPPMSLAQAVTYTWLGQAFLALLPWNADPDIAEMVRTGAVAYERLRPVDTYCWWYARALAWSMARVLPRAVLMSRSPASMLPLSASAMGLAACRRRPRPPRCSSARCTSTVLLSTAITLLINIAAASSR